MTDEMPGRARSLAILLVCQVAAMACWFASNASIAAIRAQQAMSPVYAALLTSSVQAGFVAGAFFPRCSPCRTGSTCDSVPVFRAGRRALHRRAGAVASGVDLCAVLRFIAGVSFAGVYPVGMALAATWARGDLGLLIGLLVGALTLGSASPHLAASFGGLDWRSPVIVRQRRRVSRRAAGGVDRHRPQCAGRSQIQMVEHHDRLAVAAAAPR